MRAFHPTRKQVLWTGAALSLGVLLLVVAAIGRRVRGEAPDPKVIAQLREMTRPIARTEATGGTDDLAAFDEVWRGCRVIGLGESTHGTREFFTLKHRLIQRLVEMHGCRLVTMEVSWDRARAVDAYLQHGIGSAADAVASMAFWTWNTAEVLALVEWLRAYNVRHPGDPVRFAGFDPQLPPPAAVPDTEDVSGVSAARVRAQHRKMTDAWWGWTQRVQRDRAMADNVLIFSREEKKGPVVVWAHNGHVRRAKFWMGDHLAAALGASYLVVGFSTHEGVFNAMKFNNGRLEAAGPVPAPAGRPGSIEHALHTAGVTVGWLDLRIAKQNPPELAAWLRRRLELRSEGAIAEADSRTRGFYLEWVADAYDVMIQVDRTSPTKLLRIPTVLQPPSEKH